jgi:hypothetical protein
MSVAIRSTAKPHSMDEIASVQRIAAVTCSVRVRICALPLKLRMFQAC